MIKSRLFIDKVCTYPITTIFIGLFFILTSCKKNVEQTKVQLKDVSEAVYASGIVKSKNQYQVFSKVNGTIEKLYVVDGDYIKKDGLIMKIMNQTSELNTQNAALDVENTNFNANIDKLADLNINIDLAHRKLQNDSLLWVRQANLWNQQIGTKVEYEQKELTYNSSKKTYQSAILKYRELKRLINYQSAKSKQNLAISKNIESDYYLKSETEGKIYNLSKEEGEMVNTASPIALIGDAEAFGLELLVDEDDVVSVKEGQKILVTMDSYKGEVFEAKVTKIEPLMNEKTRTFTIKAAFLKQPKLLYPNLNVEANIILQSKQKVMTIPRNYLVDGSYVMNEKNEKIKVTTGLKDYEVVEILSGLKVDEIILKPTK
jgi:HlyD family secretion protein